MRSAQFVVSVSTPDILQGTILQTLERGGQLDIWALSSVDNAGNTMSVTPPGSEAPATATRIPFEARAPRVQDDTPFSVALLQDGHVVVNFAWAAGTIQVIAVYRDARGR